MLGPEFDALREDIRANGLLTPIVLYEGRILDGGNRYKACIEAGVEPRFEEYGGSDPVHFVLSQNFHRRHLSPGQQAMVVALAQDWEKAQSYGGDRKTDQAVTSPLETVSDRRALSGVGDQTQRRADKLARTAPELAKKVIEGELSLPQALKRVEPKPEPLLPEGDESRLHTGNMSAYVAATQAKAAIRMISKKDPAALECIESIQRQLDKSRNLTKEWISENEHSTEIK